MGSFVRRSRFEFEFGLGEIVEQARRFGSVPLAPRGDDPTPQTSMSVRELEEIRLQGTGAQPSTKKGVQNTVRPVFRPGTAGAYDLTTG